MTKTIESILLVALIVLIAMAIWTTLPPSDFDGAEAGPVGAPAMQVAVITDDLESDATQSFLKGLAEEGVVVTTYTATDEKALRYGFEMAQLTGCKGLFVKFRQNALVKPYIEEAKAAGLRVVVVDNDSPDSKRDAYVGANKLLMGKQAATTLLKYAVMDQGKAGGDQKTFQILLILGEEFSGASGAATNNYINGINQGLALAPMPYTLTVRYASEKSAQLIIEEALDGPIDGLITTDPKDTEQVMNLLIDYNRIGNIAFVGSGDLTPIREAVSRKTLDASIVVDYYKMGEASMTAFLAQDEGASSYTIIPIDVLEWKE